MARKPRLTLREKLNERMTSATIDHSFPVRRFRVIDGDSVKVDLDLSFSMALFGQSCRVAAVDTPEKNTDAGQAVKVATVAWFAAIPPERLRCVSVGKGKFAGRFLGTFFDCDQPADSLTEWLLNNGLARNYGGERKPPWTPEELDRVQAAADVALSVLLEDAMAPDQIGLASDS